MAYYGPTPFPVIAGGTGATTLTGVLVGNGTGAVTATSPVSLANGGTNATSMATSTGIVKYDGTRLVTSTTALIDSSNRQTNTSQPITSAYLANAVLNVTGDNTAYTILFDSTLVNVGTAYNTATGIFTVPVTGRYLISVSIGVGNLIAGHISGIASITTTSVTFQTNAFNYFAMADVNGNMVSSFSKIIPLAATNTVKIVIIVNGSTKTVSVLGAGAPLNWFDIVLLC